MRTELWASPAFHLKVEATRQRLSVSYARPGDRFTIDA
jgi:hypothetical protein